MICSRRAIIRTLMTGAALPLAGRDALAQRRSPMADRRTALRGMATDPEVEGVQLRVWTTDTGADRMAVMRYLLDVQAALAHQPAVVFEPVLEEHLVARALIAQDPTSRVPVPHVINTGADTLMALDALGLLGDDGHRVVQTLGPDQFGAGARAALRRPDGRLAAIPFHGWPQVVWARRDWIDDDLDWPVPESVDALRLAAHALHDPARGRRGVILGTTGDFYTQQCFMMIARAFGATVLDGDGHPALNSHAMIAALEAYADLARAAGPGRLTWRARDYYFQGKAAFLFYSTFLMDDLAVPAVARDSLTGRHFDDLTGAPFDPDLVRKTAAITTLRGKEPGAVGAFASINGLGLTGFGTSSERLAARTLALFLFRRDAYIGWLHMAPGGMIPVVPGIIEDDAFMRDRLGVFRAFGRDTARRLAAALDVPSTFSTVGHGASAHADPRAARLYADGVVGRMVARVLEGDETPMGAATRAQSEAVAVPNSRSVHRP